LAWFVVDNAEGKFFQEIETASDRAVGLLAPVIVDDRLTKAIQSRWVDGPSRSGSTVFADLFRDGGVAGSYGARTSLALGMGLVSRDSFDDLRDIGWIRNAFAHQLPVESFDHMPIKDRIRNLRIVDKYPPLNVENIFTRDGYEQTMTGLKPGTDLTLPRSRFLRACEFLSVRLMRESDDQVPAKPVPRF
jgi:hypothetical protein